MNIIDEETSKEEVLNEYKTYPKTGGENLLEESPFYQSRYLPIFYEVPRGSKVLDVGCNDGTFMKMLKDRRECDVTGIDVSETALELAKAKDLTVKINDVESLDFPDESFDVVVCMEVLSHLFDPSKALKEIKRVLKPKGFMLGSCPHENLEKYIWDDKRMHRRYFNEAQLRELLGKSFDRSWVRILTGAQFAFSFAESFLSDKECEMLFKSGDGNLLNWDAALQDRSTLRCWMGFTQGPGDVYYRMGGYADKMQELGAEIHYNPFDERDMNSCSEWQGKIHYLSGEKRITNLHIVNELVKLLEASDMSVFQIVNSRDVLLILTAIRDPQNLYPTKPHRPFITEIDDWIFDLPSYNLASTPYHPNSEPESVAYDQLKLSDAIICSTEYLKCKLKELCPGKRIYVIKNTLDFNIWDNVKNLRPAHEVYSDLIRIGYSGCGNHSGDLELVAKPIETLLEEFPNLEFIGLPYPSTDFIKNPRFKRVQQWIPMSLFPQSISNWEMDIGIAPLRDNELNRAKSNLRWLEYSALKVPTIASRVEPFEKSIKDKETGILIGNSKKEWYDAIKALIIDKGNRTAIGENAYVKVKKDFNMDDETRKYISILKNIKNDSLRLLGGMRKASQRS